MAFQVSAATREKAKLPHNLSISIILLFNILMVPMLLAMKLGMQILLVPFSCTSIAIGFIYWRSRKISDWFVDAHWRLAHQHSLGLLLGYLVTGLLLAVAWLISFSAHDVSMKHIILTALTRIAIMPTLIAVMVTLVMEAGAFSLVDKGEVPEKILRKFPPPN